MHNK